MGETIANQRQGDAQQSNVLGLDGSKQNRIIDLLTQLVAQQNHSSRSQDSWCSRAGPQKGVRRHGGTPPSPPQWRNSADLRAFARWERKVEVWALQMMKAFMPPSDAALRLFTPLSGEAELETEHLDLNKVKSVDGIKYISCGYPSRAVAAEVVVSKESSCCRTTSTFAGIQTNRSVNLQTDMRASRKICLRSESEPLLFMIPSLVVTGCLTVHVSLEFNRARESLNFQSPDFKPSPPVAGSGNTNPKSR